MRYLIIILFIIAFGITNAQNNSDSLKNKNMNQEKNLFQKEEMNQIQKKIGSKEDPDIGKNMNRGKMDVFIDKDGDGICDSRQSGLSFGKMRNRKGMAGQKGPESPHGANGHSNNNNPNR